MIFTAGQLTFNNNINNDDDDNNNEYLERLTRTGPQRLHVLYKYILSKFQRIGQLTVTVCLYRSENLYNGQGAGQKEPSFPAEVWGVATEPYK